MNGTRQRSTTADRFGGPGWALKVLLILVSLISCRSLPAGPLKLMEYQSLYSVDEMVRLRTPVSCVFYTEDGLKALTHYVRRLADAPELRVKELGWLDEEGRRQGQWTIWRRECGVREVGAYVDDARVGTWNVYFIGSGDPDDGVLVTQLSY